MVEFNPVADMERSMFSLSMSKAFTREDVDPPERTGRRRSASGLPPGAVNYITARGFRRLKAELEKLYRAGDNGERADEIKNLLTSVQVVDPPAAPWNSVGFGATVILRADDGATETRTIVGVDELSFEPDGVSWLSPLGKTLLVAELGDRVVLKNGRPAKVIKIGYRTE
jgi:transcription elongation factor GreB